MSVKRVVRRWICCLAGFFWVGCSGPTSPSSGSTISWALYDINSATRAQGAVICSSPAITCYVPRLTPADLKLTKDELGQGPNGVGRRLHIGIDAATSGRTATGYVLMNGIARDLVFEQKGPSDRGYSFLEAYVGCDRPFVASLAAFYDFFDNPSSYSCLPRNGGPVENIRFDFPVVFGAPGTYFLKIGFEESGPGLSGPQPLGTIVLMIAQ